MRLLSRNPLFNSGLTTMVIGLLIFWNADELYGQAKSTHETQVVFAIDKQTPNEIKDILLLETDSDREQLLHSHDQYYLFSGIISGKYKQDTKGISPL